MRGSRIVKFPVQLREWRHGDRRHCRGWGQRGDRPGTHESRTWDLSGRNARQTSVWAGRPRFQMRRPGICGGGWGRREARERMLRQRKRSVDALRACAAVSPCHPVTRADPVPAEEASLHPACLPERRRSERGVEGKRGCHPLAPEIWLHRWFSALRRGCSSPHSPRPPSARNQADTLPAAARPGFAAPMTLGRWPMVGRAGAGRGVRAAQWPRGDIRPLLGFGSAIVSAPTGGSGPHAAHFPGDQGRGVAAGAAPGAAEPEARAPVAARGDLVRGRKRAAGGRATRGRAGGGARRVLSSAPRRRRRGAPLPPASPPRSRAGWIRARPGSGRRRR